MTSASYAERGEEPRSSSFGIKSFCACICSSQFMVSGFNLSASHHWQREFWRRAALTQRSMSTSHDEGSGPSAQRTCNESSYPVATPWRRNQRRVEQPPFPLQEFLPLHPLSPAWQPPLPLQEFKPLQACFSVLLLSARLPELLFVAFCSLPEVWAATLLAPATNPDKAAPTNRARMDRFIWFSPWSFFAMKFSQRG